MGTASICKLRPPEARPIPILTHFARTRCAAFKIYARESVAAHKAVRVGNCARSADDARGWLIFSPGVIDRGSRARGQWSNFRGALLDGDIECFVRPNVIYKMRRCLDNSLGIQRICEKLLVHFQVSENSSKFFPIETRSIHYISFYRSRVRPGIVRLVIKYKRLGKIIIKECFKYSDNRRW